MFAALLICASAVAQHPIALQEYTVDNTTRLLVVSAEIKHGATVTGIVSFDTNKTSYVASSNNDNITELWIGGNPYTASGRNGTYTQIAFKDLRVTSSSDVLLCRTTVTFGHPQRDMVRESITTALCTSLHACEFKDDHGILYRVSATSRQHAVANKSLVVHGAEHAPTAGSSANVLALALLPDICVHTDGARHTLYEQTSDANAKTELFSMALLLIWLVVWVTPSVTKMNACLAGDITWFTALDIVGGGSSIYEPNPSLMSKGNTHEHKNGLHVVIVDFATTAMSIVVLRVAVSAAHHDAFRTEDRSVAWMTANQVIITTDVCLAAMIAAYATLKCYKQVHQLKHRERASTEFAQKVVDWFTSSFVYRSATDGTDADAVLARHHYEHTVVVAFLMCVPRVAGGQFYHCISTACGVVLVHIAGRDLTLYLQLAHGRAQLCRAFFVCACALHCYAAAVMCIMPLINRSRAFSDDPVVTAVVAFGTTVTIAASGVMAALMILHRHTQVAAAASARAPPS
jgi:hypothetical protein